MKNKFLITITLVALLKTFSFSQQKVSLQNNGVSTIFGGSNPFNDAYNAALFGDTLYLPGGNIPYPAIIDKGITIIGAGHYPDSTIATNKTVLVGNLTINQNADNLHIEGIEITGGLTFSNNNKADNVVIKRCHIGAITYLGTRATACENNLIIESIIDGEINLQNAKNSIISNCIIGNRILNGFETGISNNVLLYSPTSNAYTINNTDNCNITNNIFMRSGTYRTYIHSGCELNTFANNIFSDNPGTGDNTFNSNYILVDINSIFINQSGNTFSYSHNYHLINPALYLGTDNMEVGIYGGLYVFKEGSVPINPHINLKNIAPQTNTNGELPVQIRVNAQNN